MRCPVHPPAQCVSWLAMLGLLTAGAAPAATLSLELQPAWHGHARPGEVTELGLRVLSDIDGELTVVVRAGADALTAGASLRSGQPDWLWVPVRAPADGRLRVSARVEGRRADAGVVLTLHTRALVAHAGDPSGEPGDAAPVAVDTMIPVAVSHLPRTPQAYATIGHLVLSQAAAATLDPGQDRALSEHLRACGRLTARDADPAWLARLREGAGCGGRFVGTDPVQSSTTAPGASALPSVGALHGLLPNAGFVVHRHGAAAVLVAYALLIAGLARRARALPALLAVPVLCTAVVAVAGTGAWARAGATPVLAVWVEQSAGDSARFVALLEVQGAGRGDLEVALPRALGLPLPIDPGVALALDRSRPAWQSLHLATTLGSVHRFGLGGAVESPPPLVLRRTASGPRVDNPGTLPSPPATLDWEGTRYPVPSLPPGSHWVPPATAGDPEAGIDDAAPRRLLRERTLADGPALLVKLGPGSPLLAAFPGVASGWLLIRERAA